MHTLLFDIDGTLLLTNNGGKRALEQALMEEFGLESASAEIAFAGRTDRGILDELLEINQLPVDQSHRDRLRNRYVIALPSALSAQGGIVLPGVVELLSQLANDKRVIVSVMTGNFLETAERKLSHFGLRQYVRWIVGGDLDTDRNDLARRARDFILKRSGPEALKRITVIGDTPADVRCGHAIGAHVVAVCTGGYDRETLLREKPLLVVEDLTDLAQVMPVLVG